ncbi:MAG: DUF4157 domain-containing protein [Jatrophihabitantaceae bacterium]
MDPTSAARLQALRGGGRVLPAAIRRDMEAAMGADLGGVRVHTGEHARALSDTMQASAFTLGNDVFFRDGLPDTGDRVGQHLLAHELAHTVQQRGQPVRRFSNPFKKSEATKSKDAATAAKKKALMDSRAAMKLKDAQVRLEAKSVNKTNKVVSGKIGAGYAGGGPGVKTEKSGEHLALEKEFQSWLDRERTAREEIRQRLTGGVGTEQNEAEADLAEERAADLVWQRAPVHIRAFRPLRFDDFDKALNEVRELRAQGMAEQHSDVSAMLEDNEKAFGAPLSPEKALKKVNEKRNLDRAGVRAAENKGVDPQVAAEMDKAKASSKAVGKLAESSAKRPVGAGERARVKADTERKGQEEKYGPNEDLDDATKYTGQAGRAGTYLGKGVKGGTTGVVKGKIGGATEGTGSEVSDLVGVSTSGLGQVLTFISDLLSFASTVGDIKRGTAEPGAKLVATQKLVGATSSATAITRTALLAAREGVQHFGGMGSVISEASSALPIVGLITSVLAVIDGALDLVPVSTRLATGIESVDEAVVAGKAPLAASFDRINSRNAQLVEKASFSIAKNSTMVGLHIAEIASAGGFGIPMAAKATLSIIGLAHSLGHAIYDTVGESKSSTAKKAHGVKHREGASRDVVKYDIGSSVDILIVAAQKHKLDYAKKTLMGYGVTATEVDTMRLHELREKILDGLDAEGDPKTVKEKVEEAKESVKSALGVEKGPTGPKQDKSVLDKIASVPTGIKDALAGLPGKIGKQIDGMKAKHADAKQLIASKNALQYGGISNRGSGAVLKHMVRDSDKIEKSFAKVRKDLAAEGIGAGQLPRSSEDRKKRAENAATKSIGTSTGGARQIDTSFMDKVTKATVPELYGILQSVDQNDPNQIANLEFLEYEVARRLAETGGKPTK